MSITWKQFGDIMDNIEGDSEYVLSPQEAHHLLDHAREHRAVLTDTVLRKAEAAIGSGMPKGYEFKLLAAGSNVRYMAQVKGAQSSLDEGERPIE
jgi:hypothetical protein